MLASCREHTSPTARTRYIGGCVTPPNVYMCLLPEGGARPAGRLMSPGMAAHTSCLQSFGSTRPSSRAHASFWRLRGCVGRLWIVVFIFYYYYYIFSKTQPPPPCRRTMAHRSHDHMGSQGEGCPPPSYIYIYIYIMTDTIPSIPGHPLRLLLLLLFRLLLRWCGSCFEGTPPWGHRGKIYKYIYNILCSRTSR